jgi:hypothetical protein
MKTSNQILLYDDYCPLCAWYSGLFVKYKLLAPENRQPFSTASEKLLSLIDFEKGRNEIPLVDPEKGTVQYGLDALLSILGNPFPIIEKIGKFKPVHWLLTKLYKFISYNRKVVVARKCGTGRIDCSPEFNIPYRLLLVFLSLTIMILSIGAVHSAILSHISFYAINKEQLLIATLFLTSTSYAAAFIIPRRKTIEFFGQASMLTILTALLLIPLLLLNNFITLPGWFVLAYLGLVAFMIGKEYFRRMQFIEKISKQLPLVFIHTTSMGLFICYLFIM